jgi:hypothetical protein
VRTTLSTLAAGYAGLARVTTVQLVRDLQRAPPPHAVSGAPAPAGAAVDIVV